MAILTRIYLQNTRMSETERESAHETKVRRELNCFFRGQLRVRLKLTLVSHKLLISKIRPVFVGSLFLRYGILDLAVDALFVCPLYVPFVIPAKVIV